MKTRTNTLLTIVSALVIFSPVLFAFSFIRGGDSYTIHLNDKQLVQHYVHSQKEIPNVSLSNVSEGKLSIFYSECGKIGTNRKLILKNAEGKQLKLWTFNDELKEHQPMTCSVADIKALKGNTASLYYSSREVPERILVTLQLEPAKVATR